MVVLFLVVVICGVLAGYGDSPTDRFTPTVGRTAQAAVPFLSNTPSSFADLVEQLKPAVVNIRTTKTVVTGGISPFGSPFQSPFDRYFGDDFFERFFRNMPQRQFKQKSLGSGFIISEDGYLFTNYHVVEQADEILVKLSDGAEYKAEVKGRDKNTDLALLKIEPKNGLPVAKLGSSADLRVGDWVVAIGNPFGLSQTVTAGIVSAKGRVIGAGPYDDFIQTDASINPGNSGGPLFNLAGEVVGINTAIVAQGQGIGFAIPVDMARAILPQLKDKGKVVRGWLGVSVQEITDDIAESMNLESKDGALVSDVFTGDPADKAGIKTGDIIVGIDGRKVTDTHDLLMIVAGIPVGKEVGVTVLRNGKKKTLNVVVSERSEGDIIAGTDMGEQYLGMTVQEITPDIAEHLGIPVTEGIIVTAVEEGGPAGNAGIQERDIILQVNRVRVTTLDSYRTVMARAIKKNSVLLLIQREESKFFVVIRK
ncbi:MAG: DegQ family serine endoprotease [Deltaproteobacteria bacterium]|nr:DegQ family serine endoprotease [Deltaproteobacteria bacterium]